MMKNCQHNLIHQFSETMDSLWRMDQYIKDAEAESCSWGVEFWKKYKESLEKQMVALKEQLLSLISLIRAVLTPYQNGVTLFGAM